MTLQRRLNMLSLLVALSAAAAPAIAAGKTELNARPGGKIRISYGSPSWNDEFEKQIAPGLNWRLGAGGATTIKTEAALIFADTVIFPGEYNLALYCEFESEWVLVFHNDGTFYENTKNSGTTMFTETKIEEEKKQSKSLLIELTKQKEAELPYRFSIRFGPYLLEKEFATAKARTVKGKLGKHAFTSTYLERVDLEQFRKQAVADEVCVATITSKAFEGPLKLFLRSGEVVEMVALSDAELVIPRYLKGQSGAAQKPTKVVTHSIENGKDIATLIFTAGEEMYQFELPLTLFEKLAEETRED